MQIPQSIGKYEILSRLGAGGMSEVFLARRTGAAGFEKKVALKRLASHQVEDEILIKSLINEARLAAQLSHPNLVQVFEFELIDDAYCMAMEYIDGMTLDAVLNRCRLLELPIPRGLVVYLASEVCAGLEYAHSATADDGTPLKLVHRDIKPSNIMISRRGQVKIMDFGIAKASTNPYQTTHGGGVKGTLAYMSPEQLSGSETLNATSDLFSLGVILYEMTTLERLFDDTNLFKLASRMHQGFRMEDRERVKAWFPEVVPILEKLLALDPAERYQSSRTLLLDMKPLVFHADALEMAAFLEDLSSASVEGRTMHTVHSLSGSTPTVSGGQAPEIVDAPSASSVEPAPAKADPQRSHASEPPVALHSASDARSGGAASVSLSAAVTPRVVLADGSAVPVRGFRRAILAATVVGAVVAAVAVSWLQGDEGEGDAGNHTVSLASNPVHGSDRDADNAEGGPSARPKTRADERRDGSGGGPVAEETASGAPSGQAGPAHDAGASGVIPFDPGVPTSATASAPDAGSAATRPASSRGSIRRGSEGRPSSGGQGTAGTTTVSASPPSAPTPAPRAAEARGNGNLTINADPWAEVYIDGTRRGDTPLRNLSVAAGDHTVRLVAADGRSKEFPVQIAPDARVIKVWSFDENKFQD